MYDETSLKEDLYKAGKKFVTRLADQACRERKLLKQIVKLSLEIGDHFITSRAAWTLSFVVVKQKELLLPYLPSIIKALPGIENRTQAGCLLRVIKTLDPEDMKTCSDIIDHCFHLIISKKPPMYHKAYAIEILRKMILLEPELKKEVVMIIEMSMDSFENSYLTRKAKELIRSHL